MTHSLDRSASVHAAKCELATDVLRASGTLRLQVAGWSMLPVVWPGDTLIIEGATARQICTGDIVLFGRERRLFAHRVVKTCGAPGLLTRGDAMASPDPLVSGEELLGRVCRIERNGKSFAPKRQIGIGDRIVAGLVRSSTFAARVVVGMQRSFQALQFRTSQ